MRDEIPLLRGLARRHYRAIVVDPPWHFRSYSAARVQNPSSARHVERHYRTMRLADIKALPVRDMASPDGCHLFLWATGPCMPQALQVMEAWGFKYSTLAFTWIKLKKRFDANQLRVVPTIEGDLHVGLGLTTRKNAEFILLGRTGNARRIAKDVREVIMSPRREHSRKPDEAYARIERYCDGPFLELFGRQERPNWTVRGDEVGKFNKGKQPL